MRRDHHHLTSEAFTDMRSPLIWAMFIQAIDAGKPAVNWILFTVAGLLIASRVVRILRDAK